MNVEIPPQLSSIFKSEHFLNYPFVDIPQSFQDERGTISNLADGDLGDVAIITSNSGSVRAHHFHKRDWHISYVINGKMRYSWRNLEQDQSSGEVVVGPGQMIYTPPQTAHRMDFLEESTFLAISSLSRSQENYELDTQRLEPGFSFE